MGVVSIGDKRDYFADGISSALPRHHALDGMSLLRWEQIKRYFHVENPQKEGLDHASGRIQDSRFYHKVQWLVEHTQEICMRLVDPGSVLSYDEAMIRFMGRSSNIVMATNKPIKQGYECMVLATPGSHHGYVFAFYLRSAGRNLGGPAGCYSISDQRRRSAFPLSPTNLIMIYLATLVPPKLEDGERDRNLVVLADNRFWNVPTMAYLRTIGIGGCGKFRSNARGQPIDMKN